jgi:hypothetical protein
MQQMACHDQCPEAGQDKGVRRLTLAKRENAACRFFLSLAPREPLILRRDSKNVFRSEKPTRTKILADCHAYGRRLSGNYLFYPFRPQRPAS